MERRDQPPTATVGTALFILHGYLRRAVTLDELIAWAEGVEAAAPAEPWLRELATQLANPLLCREEATAHVHDALRRHSRMPAPSS